MSILEDFFLGNIHPAEGEFNPVSAEHFAKSCQIITELKNILPSEKHEIVDSLYNEISEMSFESAKGYYINGFTTGMRFATECFTENK